MLKEKGGWSVILKDAISSDNPILPEYIIDSFRKKLIAFVQIKIDGKRINFTPNKNVYTSSKSAGCPSYCLPNNNISV